MKKHILSALILSFALSFSALAEDIVRFTCTFKMTFTETGETLASGTAYVQGDCYRCETPDGAMYCDGKNRWIYSSATDELVIQKNDLSMFKDLDLSKIKGSSSYAYEYGSFTVSLSAVKPVSDPWSATFFIPDPESFSLDTIVTDLR